MTLTADVICHELRNPLNGIYHNADIVFESMTSIRDVILRFRDEMLPTNNLHQPPKLICTPEESQALAHLIDFLDTELVQDLESLEALNLCAKHQKRIADDVLQMSKLSMNLVSLTEIPFDPLVETSNVIRMFEREAFVKNVAFKFTLGSAYRDLKIEWVRADPIRFAQVLLNFISNAVRFTEKSPRREIEVTLDASEEEPKLSQPLTTMTTGDPPPQKFTKTHPEDLGEPVFLIASVSDSGVGLTPDERANLFRKFAQASPRTHIEYGGSGLGLFISKALVDVQGGQISLESEKNKGTTLTFYIQATRVETPSTPVAVAHKSRSVSPKVLTPRIKRNPSSTSSISQIKTINVLVVEDNLVFPLALFH
jgi:signal transduction histidine kinase